MPTDNMSSFQSREPHAPDVEYTQVLIELEYILHLNFVRNVHPREQLLLWCYLGVYGGKPFWISQ